MELKRTANAGVLLKLENAAILLDGVCREVFPYLVTPAPLREALLLDMPDAVAFTHHHKDHFDPDFARNYASKTGGKVLGTAQMAQLYPASVTAEQSLSGENWRLTAVPTRHLGKGGLNTEHISFVLRAERCVWFMGDASPVELKKLSAFSHPDVLVIPYGYLLTASAVALVEQVQPGKLVLLHMPLKEQDPDGLWQLTEPGRKHFQDILTVPEMGQTLSI